MKKWFVGILVCLGLLGVAYAQTTNPLPGYIWTYFGPTLGGGWGPNPLSAFTYDPITQTLTTNASIVLTRSDAAFQIGGLNGPYIFNDTALDTVSIQAKPGAPFSGDTTNLQLYPPAVGQKTCLNLTGLADGPNEQRLLLCSLGAGQNYLFGEFVGGTGVCRDIIFSDGVSPTEAWALGCSSGGNPPDLRLGFKVPITSATPSSGVQTLMNLDASMNLLLGGGVNIGLIGFQKHILSVGSAPVVSSCGSGASVIGTDTKGIISVGTGATTSCHLAFATAYTTIPTVVLTGQGTSSIVLSLSADTTAGFTIAASADIQSTGVHYHVIQ
jgi:hypothetical protein